MNLKSENISIKLLWEITGESRSMIKKKGTSSTLLEMMNKIFT